MKTALVQQLTTTLAASSLSALADQRRATKDLARAAQETYLLLDASGSMRDDAAPETRKIDALRDVVDAVRAGGAAFRQIVFGDEVEERHDIPEPAGGTALHLALDVCRREGAPRRVVVVSDGLPDDPPAALAAARALGCAVDVFYVGPRPHEGDEFLRSLASATGGQYQATDLARPAARVALATAAATALRALPAARKEIAR